MALALLIAMGIFGGVRLSLHPTAMVAKVKLRIMQPNLQQDVRFNYSAKAEVMQKYLTLSDRAAGPQSTGVRDANILIWPESAFPFFLTREADAMAQIADLLPKGTVLITGAVRAPDLPPGTRITRAYNSIYVIDHEGSVLSVYDKLHLVPFGEYLPYQDWMEKLGFVQLTKVQGGFIAGTRRRTMDIPDAPRALPLICYEAIFPGEIVNRDDRPGWIVNLTNDGWFGISTGPYQHLQQARLRGDRGRAAGGACCKHRHLRRDRSGRTNRRAARPRRRRCTGCQPAVGDRADGLCAYRRNSCYSHARRRVDFRAAATRGSEGVVRSRTCLHLSSSICSSDFVRCFVHDELRVQHGDAKLRIVDCASPCLRGCARSHMQNDCWLSEPADDVIF